MTTPQQPDKEPLNKNSKPYDYLSPNPRDLIAYILLVLGLILLFFIPLYGGLLIGLVAGVYFSQEMAWYVTHYQEVIEEQGVVKSLILAGVLLAFLIAAPSIFVGAAIVVLLRLFIYPERD